MTPSAALANIDERQAPGRGARGPSRDEAAGEFVFLSTAPARRRDWRLACAVVAVSLIAFAAAAPFARVPLTPVGAFIPIYQSALVIGDLITSILLFGQFAILRSRALLVLASGYLFAALMTVIHTMTFPGLFAPTGLLGANPQSTAWIYMFWHGGFPLAVIAFALLGRRDGGGDRLATAPRVAIAGAIVAVVGLAGGLAWLATSGAGALPAIMIGNRAAPAIVGVVATIWALGPIGLVILWRRRAHTVLDLWLMVVLCAWTFDVGLSTVLNAARFDLGFYAGRVYGLLAASFVLCVMLVETTRLYGRLADAARQLASYAGTLEARVRERTVKLEQAHTEEQRARALNQRLFETAVDLILVADREGTLVQVSPSSLPILGYQPDEMLGRSAGEFVYPEDLEPVRAQMRETRRGRRVLHFETRYVHKQGRIVPLGWIGVWSEPEQRYFFTGRDMTDRIAAEAQLRQAQKMEAVGQLTGGVAHDFNNLLGIVVGNLDLLQERIAADAESAELLGEALTAALRGADVTRQLLAFSRRQPLAPKLVETNEIVSGISKLLARAIGEQIKVRLELPQDTWPVVIDSAQLESALLNLAVNARDAMPEGGTLTIETGNFALDGEEAATQVDGAAGNYVMIAVSDTGTGMPPEVVARVFEPFFSTKEVGKGTGLGLSMVYGFVKQSGGNAKIYSEPGTGTTVRLYLPRVGADAPRQDIAPPSIVASRGGECVLVVEDNEALRRLALRQLHDLGYETLEAGNGVDAVALIESDQAIDLLFTDIVMPGGIDGRELARRALVRRPGLAILFTSGFTAAAGAAAVAELADRLISKPFRKTELAQRVRAVLDARRDDQTGAAVTSESSHEGKPS